MSKKSFVVILGLSVVMTFVAAYMDFVFNITTDAAGLPFGFSQFNFFGAETNQTMLILDVVFWFIVIWIIWRTLPKFIKK